MTTVLIACDKFKGSLSAAEVCAALAKGIRTVRPDAELISIPIADGGDGTVAAAVSGGYEEVTATVSGPTGQPLAASFALHSATGTAVIEMAQASGLVRLPAGVRSALRATSFGTGELVRAALDTGARTIILAVGGSASTDGGAGFLQALGASLTGADGAPLGHGGGALSGLAAVDLRTLDTRLADCEIILAADVDNPLLGPEGAAAVYGPQKGADESDVAILEDGLRHYAKVLRSAGLPSGQEDLPGAGAAGGIGFAALSVLGATRCPGVDVVMDITGCGAAIAGLTGHDLVITGEGSLDAQTLSGKAVTGVSRAAQQAGVQAVAVCGQRSITGYELRGMGILQAYALTDFDADVNRCISNAAALLSSAGSLLAQERIRA